MERPGGHSPVFEPPEGPVTAPALDTLTEIERKVLWRSTAIIDAANGPTRKDPDGLKVGGHQASSASMVTIMTALWFTELTAQDRVSVKPHASPVLHAINSLLGELGPEHLGTLRAFQGPAELPESVQGPRHRRLFDRLGRDRGNGTALGSDRPPLCRGRRQDAPSGRPAVQPGRRCRTRRGGRMGGRSRSDDRRSRGDRVDRRLQPTVPGPRGPQHLGHPFAGHVRRRRMAGDHPQIRTTSHRVVRPRRWRCAEAAHR